MLNDNLKIIMNASYEVRGELPKRAAEIEAEINDYNKRYDLYYLFKWGQAIKTENKISDNIGIYKDGSIIPENLEKEYYTQAVYRYPGASKYIYTPEFTYSSTLKEIEDELSQHLLSL